MKKLAAATWGITCLGIVMMTLMFSGTSWGQEAAPTPGATAKVKAEVEEERPPELKPELKPSQEPGYFPSVVPPQRPLTLEIGPVSGILAPYGNPAALDTHKTGKGGQSRTPAGRSLFGNQYRLSDKPLPNFEQ